MNASSTVPVNREVCFSNVSGKHKPQQEKRIRKILARFELLLQPVLEPGEEIRFVTQGASPYSILELLTNGSFIQVVKLSVLVVTDRRLLQLPARSIHQPKHSIAEVRFADLASARVTGLLKNTLELIYQDGQKEKFTAVKMGKKVTACLEGRIGEGTPSAAPGRRHLCPRCARALTAGVFRCASCGLAFKNQRKATLWSLLLPGGGYFYTGQRLLGMLDAIVEGFLIIMVLGALVTVGDGEPGSVPLLAFFFAILAVEKLITIYHAHHAVKEFLPARPKDLTAPVTAAGVPAGEFAAPLEP